MGVGQTRNNRQQLRLVGNDPCLAMRMHDRIVPGRHDFAIDLLGRIERGADVGLRPLKNHHTFPGLGHRLPDRIGARDVADQTGCSIAVGVDHERQMIDEQAGSGRQHPGTQRVGLHQLRERLRIGFLEMSG